MTKIIQAKHKLGRNKLTCFSKNPNSSCFVKPYKSGPHKSKNKPSSIYGMLLCEKQKLKISYNVSEKKIKNIFNKVAKESTQAEWVAGVMNALSLKLDRVVFDACFAISVYEAAQMVSHCHFTVNGSTVNRKSFKLKIGDVVAIKGNSSLGEKMKENIKKCESKFPAYLRINEANLSIEILREPDLEEITNVAKLDIASAIQALCR